MSDSLEVYVPSRLSDITLEQYVKWVKVVTANGSDEKSEFLDRKLVEVFCGLTNSQVDEIKYSEFSKILDVLSGALSEEVPDLISRFEMDGVEYGFVPNIEEICTGAYIDAEKGMVEWSTCHEAMSALYRPITHIRKAGDLEQYEIEKYSPTALKAEVMKRIPVNVAISARVFFYTLNKELLETILKYLAQGRMKITKEEQQVMKTLLLKNGDGMRQFIHLQEEGISTLRKLPVVHYFQH